MIDRLIVKDAYRVFKSFKRNIYAELNIDFAQFMWCNSGNGINGNETGRV